MGIFDWLFGSNKEKLKKEDIKPVSNDEIEKAKEQVVSKLEDVFGKENVRVKTPEEVEEMKIKTGRINNVVNETEGMKKKFLDSFKNFNKEFDENNIVDIELYFENGELYNTSCQYHKGDECVDGYWDFENNMDFFKEMIEKSGVETDFDLGPLNFIPEVNIHFSYNHDGDKKMFVRTWIFKEIENEDGEYEEYEQESNSEIY